jgi:glycerol-3-phosphate dehydrogenase
MAMRAGFLLDRIIAFDRNRDVPAGLRLPGGSVLSREETVRRFPTLATAGLTGAAMWHDYVSTDSDRLTFSFAIAASAHGAELANYVEATAPLRDAARVIGVNAIDRSSGRAFEIGARVTVNAAGAGVNSWIGAAGQPSVPLIKAMNLVTRREAGYVAVGGRSASGRNLFLVPWKNRALFGTWESDHLSASPGAPSGFREDDGTVAHVSVAEVTAFIDEINQAFPSIGLTLGDVTLVHRGLVPAATSKSGKVELERHERIRDTNDGLITVAGTKYTTARAVAQRVTDLVFDKLSRTQVPCRTATTPLPYKPDVDILEAVREEMVVTLADAVLRRTALGALGYPGDAALTSAAAAVGAELGWPAERTQQEIADVRAFYLPIAAG